MVFAKYVIGEDPTRRMYVGAGAIVLGLMLIVAGSPHVSCVQSISSMKAYYAPPDGTMYLCYLAFALAGFAGSQLVYVAMSAARARGAPWPRTPPIVEPLCYTLSSTLVGTQSVLFVKKLASILLRLMEPKGSALRDAPADTFADWFTYFALVGWIATVVFWVTRLDGSIQKYVDHRSPQILGI